MKAIAAVKYLQREDLLVEAAQAYEAAFETERNSLTFEDYLEAALVYFVCTDFGYVCSRSLPDEFARAAYAKAKLWLKRALQIFGDHPELRFWDLYFDFVVLGEPPFVKDCCRLVETGETLVPFFYLYSSTRDATYKAKAEELLVSTEAGETAKQRYIASILAPLFKRPPRR